MLIHKAFWGYTQFSDRPKCSLKKENAEDVEDNGFLAVFCN